MCSYFVKVTKGKGELGSAIKSVVLGFSRGHMEGLASQGMSSMNSSHDVHVSVVREPSVESGSPRPGNVRPHLQGNTLANLVRRLGSNSVE